MTLRTKPVTCLGLLPVAALLVLMGCTPEYEIIETCEAGGGMRPICGMQNPEDMALLSDGHHLLVSQFGLMDGSRAGSLALLNASSGTFRVVFEGRDEDPTQTSGTEDPDWGDANCPGPPPARFSPHGIDLAPRPDGKLRLLVVNHGGREAIEFFEIEDRGQDTQVTWRGCALAPKDAYLNDVVSLPDGGLLTTHMMDRDGELSGILRASIGFDTGFVYQWQPATNPEPGFSIEPGTHGPFPNGIELSADGQTIYLNLYTAGEVRRIDRGTGRIVGQASIPSPDNSAWAMNGKLLVASHIGGLVDQMDCYGLTVGACPMAFEIVAVDPLTMETETLFSHAGPPMGAGTVAIDLGDELVIGTFAGDRAVLVKLSQLP
jgi:hypothetical protein